MFESRHTVLKHVKLLSKERRLKSSYPDMARLPPVKNTKNRSFARFFNLYWTNAALLHEY